MVAPKVSIVILTKNAGSPFQETLRQVYQQRLKPVEVLVIDSGSTDGTVDLARRYPVHLVQIEPRDFGHGRTRNLGGNLAKGEFLVFLTQDAVPVSDDWLCALVQPLTKDERLAGVYGRQLPRACNPLEAFARYYTYPPASRGYHSEDLLEFSVFHILFSNVNAALRRDLWVRFPFNEELIMSEDQDWARRVLGEGYNILYEPKAAVYHSHREGPLQLLKRSFDAGVSFQQMASNGISHPFPRTWNYLKGEAQFLIRERKGFWMPLLLPREAIRAGGFLMGRYGEKIPRRVRRWLSSHPQYWKQG